MFGLQKYLNKLYDIEWKFHDDWKDILQSMMNVTFTKHNDYYKITEIYYTYVDLLLAMEHMDFNVKKVDDTMIITILNYY
jgi:hypothetical protein